jgi:hypothetical protein
MRYQKHYTRDEARALLPEVREWLQRLIDNRVELQKHEKRLTRMLTPGRDVGGEVVNAWVHVLASIKGALLEFYQRDIQVKDLDRGLIDFPTILDGKEVFLCWENGEEDIEFWHDLDAGYAGRQKFEED